jgi:hypothetical protein
LTKSHGRVHYNLIGTGPLFSSQKFPRISFAIV